MKSLDNPSLRRNFNNDGNTGGLHPVIAAAIGLTSLRGTPAASPARKGADSPSEDELNTSISAPPPRHRHCPPPFNRQNCGRAAGVLLLPTSPPPVPMFPEYCNPLASAVASQTHSNIRPESLALPPKRQKVDHQRFRKISMESKQEPSQTRPRPSVGGGDVVTIADARTATLSFPETLYVVLSSTSNQHIMSWLPHGKGFIIHDRHLFATQILPRHFDGAKFTSFTRRLKRWKFARVPRGPEIGAYYNQHFERGRPDQVAEVLYRSEDGEQTTKVTGDEGDTKELRADGENDKNNSEEEEEEKEEEEEEEEETIDESKQAHVDADEDAHDNAVVASSSWPEYQDQQKSQQKSRPTVPHRQRQAPSPQDDSSPNDLKDVQMNVVVAADSGPGYQDRQKSQQHIRPTMLLCQRQAPSPRHGNSPNDLKEPQMRHLPILYHSEGHNHEDSLAVPVTRRHGLATSSFTGNMCLANSCNGSIPNTPPFHDRNALLSQHFKSSVSRENHLNNIKRQVLLEMSSMPHETFSPDYLSTNSYRGRCDVDERIMNPDQHGPIMNMAVTGQVNIPNKKITERQWQLNNHQILAANQGMSHKIPPSSDVHQEILMMAARQGNQGLSQMMLESSLKHKEIMMIAARGLQSGATWRQPAMGSQQYHQLPQHSLLLQRAVHQQRLRPPKHQIMQALLPMLRSQHLLPRGFPAQHGSRIPCEGAPRTVRGVEKETLATEVVVGNTEAWLLRERRNSRASAA